VDKKSEAESGRVYLVKDLGAALHGRGVAVTQGMRLLLSVWTIGKWGACWETRVGTSNKCK